MTQNRIQLPFVSAEAGNEYGKARFNVSEINEKNINKK